MVFVVDTNNVNTHVYTSKSVSHNSHLPRTVKAVVVISNLKERAV